MVMEFSVCARIFQILTHHTFASANEICLLFEVRGKSLELFWSRAINAVVRRDGITKLLFFSCAGMSEQPLTTVYSVP